MYVHSSSSAPAWNILQRALAAPSCGAMISRLFSELQPRIVPHLAQARRYLRIHITSFNSISDIYTSRPPGNQYNHVERGRRCKASRGKRFERNNLSFLRNRVTCKSVFKANIDSQIRDDSQAFSISRHFYTSYSPLPTLGDS